MRGGGVGGEVHFCIFASNFNWFLGDFGLLLLVESDFGWFQVVGCISSYTNFTPCRRVNSLLYSCSHVIE